MAIGKGTHHSEGEEIDGDVSANVWQQYEGIWQVVMMLTESHKANCCTSTEPKKGPMTTGS